MMCDRKGFKPALSRKIHGFAGIASAIVVLGLMPWGVKANWTPERNVEIVIASGPGSGTDIIGRHIQSILSKGKLTGASLVVVNKPGGGGGLGLAYLNQYPRNGHFLYVTSPTLLTSFITGTTSINYTDLTPLAQLFNEYVLIAAGANSKVRDAKDLMERLRRDPSSVSIGTGTSVGNANHIAIAAAMKAIGGDPKTLKIVIFKSGGEIINAVMGGHVDISVTGAVSVIPHLQSGKLRAIAITAPKRQQGALAGVPTLVEQGTNSVAGQWRGIVGPRGMSEEQVAYWDQTFSRLAVTSEWTGVLESNVWEGTYMNSANSRKFLDAEYRDLKDILIQLGFAK